jgi:hypothetical protein
MATFLVQTSRYLSQPAHYCFPEDGVEMVLCSMKIARDNASKRVRGCD